MDIDKMIPIDSQLENFKQYLDNNRRCILSSRFGNGKSYFLSNFIEKNSENYLFIPIYPVNYQVMDNKDIFELIKRDILIRLLSNEDIKIDGLDDEKTCLFWHFLKTKSLGTIADILEMAPDITLPVDAGIDIGINIGNAIKKFREIIRKYKDWKKDETKDVPNDYIKSFDKLMGSIYEFDTISQLITEIIYEYKQNNPNKKVVLVIEDLDRIDPAHIFRILNVFSAHFDRYDTFSADIELKDRDNKFGFDKIVLVCDIENIKNIYHHVYGEKTDFLGYINKFSTSLPYKYSLQDLIKDYIINELFEKELVTYPKICDCLAGKIVSMMNSGGNEEVNLRTIRGRIINAKDHIKQTRIQLTKQLQGKYIPAKSAFTYFLSLLKSFEIDFQLFRKSLPKDDIISLIGVDWYIVGEITDDIRLRWSRGYLDISYIIHEKGYRSGEYTAPSYAIKETSENEMPDFSRLCLRYIESVFVGELYKHIDEIVGFLRKKVII